MAFLQLILVAPLRWAGLCQNFRFLILRILLQFSGSTTLVRLLEWPSRSSRVILTKDLGFGSFDAQLSLARSPLFGEWSLLAGSASNGSTAPVPVSAANPVTGGGNDNDDDDGDDIDDDNDVDDGIDDDIDDDDNDDNDGGIAFGSGTGKAAGAGGAAVASKGNKKKSNKVDN